MHPAPEHLLRLYIMRDKREPLNVIIGCGYPVIHHRLHEVRPQAERGGKPLCPHGVSRLWRELQNRAAVFYLPEESDKGEVIRFPEVDLLYRCAVPRQQPLLRVKLNKEPVPKAVSCRQPGIEPLPVTELHRINRFLVIIYKHRTHHFRVAVKGIPDRGLEIKLSVGAQSEEDKE
ncbi:MAG: hypothetical protein BWY89_02000 [Bacteroidetes bacterium ADurb.BinA012]|nr:MAG: hypothetical protein BWY89_02000 [Bacteroidetes bacterium ADurb.BinA012]